MCVLAFFLSVLIFLFPTTSMVNAFPDVTHPQELSSDRENFPGKAGATERSHTLCSAFPGESNSRIQPGLEGNDRPGLLGAIQGFNLSGGLGLPAGKERLTGKYAFSLLDEDIHTLLHERKKGASGPDWKGIARDTGFYLLYQPVILGVFYLLPESVINYTADQKKISAEKWWRHVRDPRFDRDSFWLNFIAHPYWGSTFYTRARERGFDRIGSFGYAVLLSTMFEYLTESWYEPVSYNDLLVTPVLGSLLGAFVFEPLRDYVKSKPSLKWYDHATLILTDPLGTANSFMERLLGIESTLRVYYRPSAETRSASNCQGGEGRCLPAPRFGLDCTFQW